MPAKTLAKISIEIGEDQKFGRKYNRWKKTQHKSIYNKKSSVCLCPPNLSL
jgi:hypothetical protein